MNHFIRLFVLLGLCLGGSGCIADHHLSPESDNPRDPVPNETPCDVDDSVCGDGQICAIVDLCDSQCSTSSQGDGVFCEDICMVRYACVDTLVPDEACNPTLDHCGENLECREDLDAGCQPSFCGDGVCTADCMPVYTCQPPLPPTRCEDLDCDEGFECTIEVREGCGLSDPQAQRACEAQPWERAICVRSEGPQVRLGLDEMCNIQSDHCAAGLSCQFDESVCGPSDCIHEGCLECPEAYTCQPAPGAESCDDILCEQGYVCETQAREECPDYYDPADLRRCESRPLTSARCVRLRAHIMGERCTDTMCMVGYECMEEDLYLPCDGPGCDEPVDILVTCVEVDGHRMGDTCEETVCMDGYECRESQDLTCHGPGCDPDPIEASVHCEPVPPPVGVGEDPEQEPGFEAMPRLPGEHEECVPGENTCAGDLTCTTDEDVGCRPSFCDGDICTSDCMNIYTCQNI